MKKYEIKDGMRGETFVVEGEEELAHAFKLLRRAEIKEIEELVITRSAMLAFHIQGPEYKGHIKPRIKWEYEEEEWCGSGDEPDNEDWDGIK